MDMSLSNYILAAGLVAVLLTCLYRCLLPRPIPGIPFNKKAAKSILGDISGSLAWHKDTGEIWTYIRKCAEELNSPIFQMFMRGPFGKPWIVITDYRESYDIQMFRQGEFDRSAFLGEVFGPLLPGNHVWMLSNDEFRAHRNLIRDTMSPAFLHEVAAPAIHSAIGDLVALWGEKARLARGRPFRADQDIVRGVVDLILLATLGIETRMSQAQRELLHGPSSINVLDNVDHVDTPVVFPTAAEARTYTAIRTLVDSIHIGMTSPVPRIHMNFALRFFPSLVAARKHTDAIMTEVLDLAWKRACENPDTDDKVASAVDLLVRREAQMARKKNRMAEYSSRTIRDELFGFYLAGHDTTSTTLCWAFKRLTAHQDVQHRLRAALHAAHGAATAENRMPTAREIVETSVPYLDAFIEENHRLATSIPTVIRRTTCDTVVLGHKIPSGTDVFMMLNGPDFQGPALPVDESLRSQTSRERKDRYTAWPEEGIDEFRPERFLVEENGSIKFDPFAGPVLPYGVGLRGCFGVKLAILELRMIITMIVWSFELRKTPEALSSFKAADINTHRPKQMYLRLTKI